MGDASRARWLLLCGSGVGIALAAAGVLRAPPGGGAPDPTAAPGVSADRIPAGNVARVNGRLISFRDFDKVIAQEMAEGTAVAPGLKQRLLDRMIDEELRVQRAVQLDLHLTDARVRMDLASAMAEAATAAAGQAAPDERTLRAFFEKRRQLFAQRGPIRVRRVWVAIIAGNLGEAFARARTAATLLREKEAFETVREIAGNTDPRPVPNKLLLPEELATVIGRAALNVALTLTPGQVSDPIRATDGFQVLLVVERRAQESVSFEGCRLDVEAEYWSTRAGDALAANAAELRRSAVIEQVEAL